MGKTNKQINKQDRANVYDKFRLKPCHKNKNESVLTSEM